MCLLYKADENIIKLEVINLLLVSNLQAPILIRLIIDQAKPSLPAGANIVCLAFSDIAPFASQMHQIQHFELHEATLRSPSGFRFCCRFLLLLHLLFLLLLLTLLLILPLQALDLFLRLLHRLEESFKTGLL